MKKTNLAVLTVASTLCFTGTAFADTYTFDDTWTDWPGYTSNHSGTDALGNPAIANITGLTVTLSNDNASLQKVEIALSSKSYLNFNSLFINTGYTSGSTWDAWDYLVHDGGSGQSGVSYNGTLVDVDGLYSVDATYSYTSANDNSRWNVREGNPNGIDAGDLTLTALPYSLSLVNNVLTYDFGNGLGLTGGFFVAWAPWCANDVIGGGQAMDPVPEPATILLFGAGLSGLASIARRRRKS
ncbi:MAG: PEP-CTERM sorting domain-containing protein [Desulfopila sp.]